MKRRLLVYLLTIAMAVSPLTVFAGTEAEDGQNDAAAAEAVLDDSAAAEEQAEPAEAQAEDAEAAETAEAVPEEEAAPAEDAEAAAEKAVPEEAEEVDEVTAETPAEEIVPDDLERVQSEAKNFNGNEECFWVEGSGRTKAVDKDGNPATGLFKAQRAAGKLGLYYADSNGLVVTKEGPVTVTTGEKYIYTMVAGETGWTTTGGDSYTYLIKNHDGDCYAANVLEGLETAGGQTYYVKNGLVRTDAGILDYQGSKYYIQAGGAVQTTPGFVTAADGSKYYVQAADGKLRVTEGLFTFSGKTYYSDAAGKVNTAKGLITAADGSKYFAESDGSIRTKEGFVYPTGKTGKKYYIPANSNGKIMTDGQVLSRGKYMYVVKPGGAIRTKVGFTTLENGTKRYYVKKTSGVIYFNKSFKVNGKTYHASPTGELYTGAHKWKSNYYFASAKGTVRTKKGIVEDANGKRYYVKKGGKIAVNKKITYKGKSHIASKTGAFYIGLFKWKNTKYYATEKGTLKTKNCIIEVNGDRYFVHKGGKVAVNEKVSLKGKSYIAKKSGKFYTGLFTWKGTKYYASSKGTLKTKDGFVTVGGKKYFVFAGGKVCINDTFKYNGHYYITGSDGQTKKGWVNQGGYRYYAESDGILMSKEFFEVGSKRYYAREGGRIYRNSEFTVNGNTYYADSNGVIQTGKFSRNGNYYIAGSDGIIVTSEGLTTYNGTTYYVRKGGKLATSTFVTSNGRHYYAGQSGAIAKSHFTYQGYDVYPDSSSGAISDEDYNKIFPPANSSSESSDSEA